VWKTPDVQGLGAGAAIPSRYDSAFFLALDPRAIEEVFSDLDVYRRGLAEAKRRAAGETEGFFGPESAVWRVFGDPLVSAGAIRAVAFQILHPAIAAAGAQHSQFRQNFIGRAWQTYATMSELVFGDLSTACAASERIHVVHAMVRGAIPAEASPTRAGSPYRANDPALLMWVLATLYEASVFATDRLIRPMPAAERSRMYDEMRLLGSLIGIPPEAMPSDLSRFDRYWESMLATELEAGPVARELMAFLMRSSLSRLSRWTRVGPLTRLDDAWIKASIPGEWAVALGLRPTEWDRRAYARATRALRLTRRALPETAARIPAHHQGTLRVARAAGRRGLPLARLVEQVNRRRRLPMSLKPVEPLSGAAAEMAADLLGSPAAERTPRT
jgi:uncharacterized protein (DUF2236 family)